MQYILNEEGMDIARLGVSAVPIPAAGWLLLSGLGVLVGIGRRLS
ncbi:MAG: VPLPA-CTERM sorting domain-containing protein [Candidatus Thiodiazotropha sp. 6PDIVS]